MKILLLIDSLIRGGKERRMLELVKGLKAYPEIKVELVIFKNKIEYPEVFELNIATHIIERKPKKDPRVFYKLYRICQQFKPDIIHSWGTMPSIYAIPSAKLCNIKLINGNVTNAPLKISKLNTNYLRAKFTYLFSDMIIGNSKAGLKAYNTPKDRSQCIYNGFDFTRIADLEDKATIKAQLQIKTPKVVGMVGAFFARKDYETYIAAACEVLKTRKDVSFLAIGDGPDYPYFKAKIPKIYKDKILLPGMMKKVESVINIFDIGILSTNTKVHGEGISNAILEYMVMGKAVIASAGGGTNEIVVDQETGYLVPPCNPDAMATQINYLLDRPNLAKKMGEKGEKRITECFSLKRMQEDYVALYDRLMK